MSDQEQDIIIITGQTATGKTRHALKLAQENSSDIVSCDSRQLYKHLNIITGKDVGNNIFQKVSNKVVDGVNMTFGYYKLGNTRIWGYDIVDPTESFSSHLYKQYLHELFDEHFQKGAIPIIVGGTYLYIKDLMYGFNVKTSANWKLRGALEKLSVNELQTKLRKIDKNILDNMNNSDRNNPRRLIRRIEISNQPEQTKKHSNSQKTNKTYNAVNYIGLRFSPEHDIRKTIQARVEKRLKQGAVEEVQHLLDKGYTNKDPGLQAIGYQQIISHLRGDCTLSDTIEQWVTAEVQYAKRQLTFMKKDRLIDWKKI